MARRWTEREHPRHPGGSREGGQFRERVGGGGWAARLASMIGRGRTGGDEHGRFGPGIGYGLGTMLHGDYGVDAGPHRGAPPWEGGPPDVAGVHQQAWANRVHEIFEGRGIDPADFDITIESEAYDQYQMDPAEYVDSLMDMHGLPGGRSDELGDDPGDFDADSHLLVLGLDADAEQERLGRLTGQDVAQALTRSPREHAVQVEMAGSPQAGIAYFRGLSAGNREGVRHHLGIEPGTDREVEADILRRLFPDLARGQSNTEIHRRLGQV